MELISWLLWAIVETANPNVNAILLVEEFLQRDSCIKIAKSLSEMSSEDMNIQPGSPITGITLACIPVTTRTNDANEPVLQPLPRKNNQRTTTG
jgi:hypothetical protein